MWCFTPARTGQGSPDQGNGPAPWSNGHPGGALVSESLAQVMAECLRRTGQSRFLLPGETSDAVCRALGIGGMRVWQEIAPGLPSCYSLSHSRISLC